MRLIGRRRTPLLFAAAASAVAALAAGGPASANAAPRVPKFQSFYEFTIAFRGEGSYTRTGTNTETGAVLTVNANWRWNSVYPHVLIPTTGSSPLLAAGFPAFGLGQSGTGDWKITNIGSMGEDCSNSGTLGLKASFGGGGVKVHRVAVGTGKGLAFNLIALTGYATTSGAGNNQLPCDPSDFWSSDIEGGVSPGVNHTGPGLPDVSPLSVTVKLAPSDLKHASVLKHVSIGAAEMVPADCGSGHGTSCHQSYTWSGTVKFTKHKLA